MAEIEFHTAVQLSPQSLNTSAYTAITGASLAAGDLVDGDRYWIVVTAQVRAGNAQNRQVRLVHGSTPFAESEQIDVGGADLSFVYQFQTVWEAVSGEGITLEARVTAAGSGTIDQISIFAMNLDADLVENTDWFWVERSTDDSLSTTPTDGASTTFTPGGAGNWLIQTYGQFAHTDTTTSFISALVRSGEASTGTPSARSEMAVSGSAGRLGMLLSRVFAVTAVSNTFKEQASASATAHTRLHSSLFALRLGAFAQSNSAYTEADENLGVTDFATQLQTVSITPALTGDFVVGTYWGWDGANVARTAKWRVQIEGSDSPAGQTTDSYNFSVRDATDERPMAMIQVAALSSGAARAIDLDASVSSITSTPTGQHRSIWAFSLELGGGEEQLPATIVPETADATLFIDDTPDIEFTGTDQNTVQDPLTYRFVATDNPDAFTGGEILMDSATGGGASLHTNPRSGLTWEGFQQLDDRFFMSFMGNGSRLTRIRLWLSRDEADTDGEARVLLYVHQGVFGTSSAPFGAVAAEDTPTPGWIAESTHIPLDGTMSTSNLPYDFVFTNGPRLEDGVPYGFSFDWIPNGTSEPSTNTVDLEGDSTPAAAGNAYVDGDSANWGVRLDFDIRFEAYGEFILVDAFSDTDPGFTDIDGATTDPFDSGNTIRYTFQTALTDGVYYWQAYAFDVGGTGTWSSPTTTRSFTVLADTALLVVPRAVQDQTVDSPSLVQQYLLTVQDVTQAQTPDTVSLVQQYNLAVQDAAQAQSPEVPTLITDASLVPQDVAQAQTVDSPGLVQQYVLTVQDASQAQTVDNSTLITGDFVEVQDVSQAQTVDNVQLAVTYVLAVQDVSQAQTVDQPGLIQQYLLAVQDALQGQAVDTVDFNPAPPGPAGVGQDGGGAAGLGRTRPQTTSKTALAELLGIKPDQENLLAILAVLADDDDY